MKLSLKYNLLILLVTIANIAFCQTKKTEPTYKYLKSGDIIFINKYPEHKKELDFVGVVFIENKIPFVVFADSAYTKCAVKDFINKSYKKKYAVKRLIEKELITEEAINTMRSYASGKLNLVLENISYYNTLNIYNTLFIWKLYQSSIGLALCEHKTAKVETPKHTFENTKIVDINDIYTSELMEDVSE